MTIAIIPYLNAVFYEIYKEIKRLFSRNLITDEIDQVSEFAFSHPVIRYSRLLMGFSQELSLSLKSNKIYEIKSCYS